MPRRQRRDRCGGFDAAAFRPKFNGNTMNINAVNRQSAGVSGWFGGGLWVVVHKNSARHLHEHSRSVYILHSNI